MRLHASFLTAALLAAAPVVTAYAEGATGGTAYASVHDLAVEKTYARRAADWRNGALVYQVIVDRFAESDDLDAKRELYPAPKRLREWSEEPRQGTYLDEVEVWSHEIDFWGGDLQSLRRELDWIEELGVDVLYLNPIVLAYTNHKYDAQDFFEISPEYGTRDDLRALTADVHTAGMRIVLDGVFNHMGRTSPWFQAFMNDDPEWAGWFYKGDEYNMGYRGWYNVANLPELNLENPTVRERLFLAPDSVVQGYLAEGIDGWRLDVAFDMGFTYLGELTRAAHATRPGSLVIGEIWNYPAEWSPSVDGVMNMTLRHMILETLRGNISGPLFGRHVERMIDDTGIEPLLKAWIILDNHDTPRLTNELPQPWQQRMAQVLQFTLPGSPCIYYGVELGMTGGHDPEQRGPMRWDLANEENETLRWTRSLIDARNSSPALRHGDFRLLDTEGGLAFLRHTNRAADTRIVLANPSEQEMREVLIVRESKMMSGTRMQCMLDDDRSFQVYSGTMHVTLPPHSFAVLQPVIEETVEYNFFKRVW